MLRPQRQILDSKLQPSPLAPSTNLMSLTTLRKRSFRSGSMVMPGYHCRDDGAIGSVRAKPCLAACQPDNGSGSQHRLAHTPGSQPDHCHVWIHNGLYGRLRTACVHICSGTTGPDAHRSRTRPCAYHPERRRYCGINHRWPTRSLRSGQGESTDRRSGLGDLLQHPVTSTACSTPLGDSFLHLFFSFFDPQRRDLVGVG